MFLNMTYEDVRDLAYSSLTILTSHALPILSFPVVSITLCILHLLNIFLPTFYFLPLCLSGLSTNMISSEKLSLIVLTRSSTSYSCICDTLLFYMALNTDFRYVFFTLVVG